MFEWDPRPGFNLTGKRALVVGFSNPAGHSIALAMAEAGADVATASATLDAEDVLAAKRASKAVAALSRKTFAQGWDVTLPTNVTVGLKQLTKEFGQPTILVFNADQPLARTIEKTTDAEFARVQQVNLNGAFYSARSFLRDFPGSGPGRLIFVNSIFGERGIGSFSAYAAAKAGVIGLSAALSQEVAGRGITSNCISTGWMDWTPGRGPDDIAQNRLMRFIPMRRFGSGDELGALAVLLASDASGYLNGQVFHVDGGIMTHL